LKRNLQKLVTTLPDVEDVLLFGSAVRGKVQPKDIDILILFKKKVDKHSEYLIRKELENYYSNLSIVSKTLTTALEPTFDARESILFEGVSLLSRKISLRPMVLFRSGCSSMPSKGGATFRRPSFTTHLMVVLGMEGFFVSIIRCGFQTISFLPLSRA